MFAKNEECFPTFWFIHLKAINRASSPFKKENLSLKYDPIVGLYRNCPTNGEIGSLIYFNLILEKTLKYRENIYFMFSL